MIKINKIIPVFNGIITTANKYPKHGIINDMGLIDVKYADKLKEYQTILEVGPIAKSQGFEVGQVVLLNYINYIRVKHRTADKINDDFTIDDIAMQQIDVPTYTIYDKDSDEPMQVLYLFDRDVVAIAEGEDIVDKAATAEDALEAQMLAQKISQENHSGKGTKILRV